jgi:hypothetical protein
MEIRQSLPVEPGQPCVDACERLGSGNNSAHREQKYEEYAESESETELGASYVELEEGEGRHRHYCSVLVRDMSSADESRGASNEEELGTLELNV